MRSVTFRTHWRDRPASAARWALPTKATVPGLRPPTPCRGLVSHCRSRSGYLHSCSSLVDTPVDNARNAIGERIDSVDRMVAATGTARERPKATGTRHGVDHDVSGLLDRRAMSRCDVVTAGIGVAPFWRTGLMTRSGYLGFVVRRRFVFVGGLVAEGTVQSGAVEPGDVVDDCSPRRGPELARAVGRGIRLS